METRLRAALYLRLSKEDADKIHAGDDSASIVNQRLLLTDYALSQGWAIADTYIDDDYSGLYDDRPGFDRLIRDSRLGRFEIVLCKSQSRFTRNMEHLEKYLHHDFVLLGIRFIGLVDGVDTSVEGNKKTRQIYGLTNEWYCEDLSRNIRSVFRQKMKAGQFLGSFAPYGYLKDPEDGHKFIVDEYAAKVVNMIYDLALEGYGSKVITHMLEDKGIDNPTVYKKKQGNYANIKAEEFSVKYNFWSTTTVNRILANDTYLGTLTQGRWEKISYKDKKVVETSKDRWVVIKNHHAPIISQDKFDRVQKMKGHRRRTAAAGKVHKLAGKLRCADCGSSLVKSGYTNHKMEDWNLRCQLANKSRKKLCTNHVIRYSVIERIVLDNIRALVNGVLENQGRKEQLSQVLNRFTGSYTRMEELRKERDNYRDRKTVLERKLSLLYDDRVGGIVTEQQFRQLKTGFDREYDSVVESMTALDDKLAVLEQESREKRSIEELIEKYCSFDELTHEMAADFIDYIEVGEKDPETGKQEIKIHWNL